DYQTLTAMLAPALFMTATASLILSANNRLARIVDRLRSLLADLAGADSAEEDRYLRQQIARQRRRCRMVLRAGRLLYVGLSSFVCTSLAVAVDASLDHRLVHLPTALASLGVLLVLAACIYLAHETGIAVHVLEDELDHALQRHPQPNGASG